MQTQANQTPKKNAVKPPMNGRGAIKARNKREDSGATLEAGTGEHLTATIGELDPVDAREVREKLETSGTTEARPKGFIQALASDVKRFQGFKNVGRDAYGELRGGFSLAYSEIRAGFVKARHEFSVGLDRAISKVLS